MMDDPHEPDCRCPSCVAYEEWRRRVEANSLPELVKVLTGIEKEMKTLNATLHQLTEVIRFKR